MERNRLFHKILNVIFIAIMCNAFVTPALCTLKDTDFSYDSLTLTEEETKNSNNLIEEEEKLVAYTSFCDFSDFILIQNRQFASKKLFLNDDYFDEILLPPPEQNLV